jgi:hypothetical protein
MRAVFEMPNASNKSCHELARTKERISDALNEAANTLFRACRDTLVNTVATIEIRRGELATAKGRFSSGESDSDASFGQQSKTNAPKFDLERDIVDRFVRSLGHTHLPIQMPVRKPIPVCGRFDYVWVVMVLSVSLTEYVPK